MISKNQQDGVCQDCFMDGDKCMCDDTRGNTTPGYFEIDGKLIAHKAPKVNVSEAHKETNRALAAQAKKGW